MKNKYLKFYIISFLILLISFLLSFIIAKQSDLFRGYGGSPIFFGYIDKSIYLYDNGSSRSGSCWCLLAGSTLSKPVIWIIDPQQNRLTKIIFNNDSSFQSTKDRIQKLYNPYNNPNIKPIIFSDPPTWNANNWRFSVYQDDYWTNQIGKVKLLITDKNTNITRELILDHPTNIISRFVFLIIDIVSALFFINIFYLGIPFLLTPVILFPLIDLLKFIKNRLKKQKVSRR